MLKILDRALEDGFRTLRYDGMMKVLQGITTIDEVNRVTEEPMV